MTIQKPYCEKWHTITIGTKKRGADIQGVSCQSQRQHGRETHSKVGKTSGKAERKYKCQKVVGCCSDWTTKRQCARGDSCSFEHDQEKKTKAGEEAGPPHHSVLREEEMKKKKSLKKKD